MKRRKFLKTTGQATVLAFVTAGTGFFFHNRISSAYQPLLVKTNSFEVPVDLSLPKISLCKNDDPIQALQKSLDAIGGIKRFIRSGETVTVKPNVGWDRTPAQAANTNPILVGEMVRLCLEAGAAEVIVTDVTCNDPRRCFLRSGIKEATQKAGGKVIIPTDDDFIKTDLKGSLLTTWPVVQYFVKTDKLINMPIVKQHSLSTCTLSMKNLYGILGGRRNQLHQQIDQSIVDLAAFCRPTLTVIDATHVLLRGGPQGGSLDDVAIENTVICSTDQVAADARGAEFLGFTGDQISHISLAQKSGLGSIDYNSIGYKVIS